MSDNVLEECCSLRSAIESVKNRLREIDKQNFKHREWYKENMPDRIRRETMEEENCLDNLYLVYRNDYYNDVFYIFEDSFDIENWLSEKWSDWDLWDYDDINGFLETTLVVWEFHRDICKDKWRPLYKNSKQFIDGWSRKREYAGFEPVPTFSVG